jgi:ADP-ribosylglycohydrolase
MVDFHAGKEAGDLTHYGDQAFELLISVSTGNEFDPDNFMSRWRAMFKGSYKDFLDEATVQTLEQFGECTSYTECVSRSSELGGASRIAPLLVVYHHKLDGLIDAAIEQTRLTHNDPMVMESAAFFAETVYEVIQGKTPAQAMESVIKNSSERYGHILDLIKSGLGSGDKPTKEALASFGSGNDVKEALPLTIHLIAKYENDFTKAITENIMLGGDSAARGMLIGMIVGAQTGMNGIPAGWFVGLRHHEELIGYINQTLHDHYYDYTIQESY